MDEAIKRNIAKILLKNGCRYLHFGEHCDILLTETEREMQK